VARQQPQASDVIHELESVADRAAHWIGENLVLSGLLLLLLLGAAGAWGGYRSWDRSREEAASNALDKVQTSYLLALGAPPGALEEPELANPEAAREIRERYLGEFQAVAEEHAGTVAGTLALFEAAQVLERLGRAEQTEEAWRAALASASGNPGLTGLLQQRIAEIYEAREDWRAAAEAHEAAGAVERYPLRYWALLDAARCWAAAGDPARALALYDRVEAESPELNLPPHLRAQARELRATAGS
jgi:tetratricopeptide (TPR) repeat protein